MAFLLFGFRPLLRLAWGARPRAWALYLSIGWSLVSWWPHDNLHAHNGMALQGLLYIEYGFHVTLIVAAFVLALSLLTLLRPGGDADFEPVAGAAPVVGERTAA